LRAEASYNSNIMRLCFFGGTFDPPHRGHIIAARAAADRFTLERVLLVPANVPPHKQSSPVTDYVHRLAMVELAVSAVKDARLEASEMESPARTAGKPNYSLLTIQKLRSSLPADGILYFLLGADAFQGFNKWYKPEKIAALCEFIVVSRPKFDFKSAFVALPEKLKNTVKVHTIDTVMEDVSATQVREMVANDRNLSDLVSPEVAAYISENNLYK